MGSAFPGDKSLNACILDGIDGSGQILGLTDQATKCLAELRVVGGMTPK